MSYLEGGLKKKKKKKGVISSYNPVDEAVVTHFSAQWAPAPAQIESRSNEVLSRNRLVGYREATIRSRIIERSLQELTACDSLIKTRIHRLGILDGSKCILTDALNTARRLHWVIASRCEENTALLASLAPLSGQNHEKSATVPLEKGTKDDAPSCDIEISYVFSLLREERTRLVKSIQDDESSLENLRPKIETLEDSITNTLAEIESENRFLSIQKRFRQELQKGIEEEMEIISLKHRIPDDLLISIFKVVVELEVADARALRKHSTRLAAPSYLSQVCRRWRGIIKLTSSLWDYVSYPPPIGDSLTHQEWLESRLHIARSTQHSIISWSGEEHGQYFTNVNGLVVMCETLSLILDNENSPAKMGSEDRLKSFEIVGQHRITMRSYTWMSKNTRAWSFRGLFPRFSKDVSCLTDLRLYLPSVESAYLEHIFASLPDLRTMEIVLDSGVSVVIPPRASTAFKLSKLSSLIASRVILDAVISTWLEIPSLQTLGVVVDGGDVIHTTLQYCLEANGVNFPRIRHLVLRGVWTSGVTEYVREALLGERLAVRTLEIEGDSFSSFLEHLAQSTFSLPLLSKLVLRDADISSSCLRQLIEAREATSTRPEADSRVTSIKELVIAGRNGVDRSFCEEMEAKMESMK
ncbi:hypothetical protein FRC17_004024, partial [Serendipita sp. 399]